MSFGDDIGPDKRSNKYNGKEEDRMHGLNSYDYSVRHYEPDKGRFTTVDPLAEKFYFWSPYVYCYNNPIKFIDPDGRKGQPASRPNTTRNARNVRPQQGRNRNVNYAT